MCGYGRNQQYGPPFGDNLFDALGHGALGGGLPLTSPFGTSYQGLGGPPGRRIGLGGYQPGGLRGFHGLQVLRGQSPGQLFGGQGLGPQKTPEMKKKMEEFFKGPPPKVPRIPRREDFFKVPRLKTPELVQRKDPGKGKAPEPVRPAKKEVAFGHNHSDLTYQDLVKAGKGAYKLFKNEGHYAHDLSRMVEQACRDLGTSQQTKEQADGLNTFRRSMYPGGLKHGQSFMRDSGFDLGDEWKASDEIIIGNFCEKFDQMFFFGTMAARSSWEIDWQMAPGLLGECLPHTVYGYNTQVGGASPHIKCRIRLQKSATKDRQKRLLAYLGTLLHEMCHGFMHTWSCEERSCRQNPYLLGCTGHGNAWQNTCVAVDRAVQKHLGLKLALNRMFSYALDLSMSGVSPSKHVGHWRIDPDKLQEALANIRIAKKNGWRVPV